jgi:beta-lactam-binding protein with PASTA domain
MSFGQRVRTLFRLSLLLTFLVAVALISAITTIRLTIHGRQQTMPNLVGVALESAKRTAGWAGLDMVVQDKVFSTQYAAGQIVSQIPPANTRIKAGQRAHVLVSLGRPQVQIPNLTGSSFRAARIMVLQRGLTMGNVTTVPWPQSEVDQVVAQDPPPASEAHSLAMNFLVSLGERPVEDVLCPSFIGRSFPEVRRVLEKAGFKVGGVTTIPTTDATKNAILSQSPPPGSKIGPGTKFDFQATQ